MGSSALLFLCFMHACAGQLQWRRINPSSETIPAPREGHVLGYHHGSRQLIMFGGASGKTVSGETWLYNVDTNMWRVVNTTDRSAPTPRKYLHSGVIESLNIFVISLGFGAAMAEFGDTWVFSFDTEQWTEIQPTGNGISVRYGGHFGVHYRSNTSTFWIGSGFTMTTGLASRYSDLYQLVFTGPTTAAWKTLWDNPSSGNQFNPLTPHGRCLQGSAVVSENVMVIYGGCMRGGSGGGPCPTNDAWSFDSTTGRWTQIPSCPTPRVWSAMAPLTNRPGMAVLYGGSEKFSPQLISVVLYPEDEVFVVDANTNGWSRLHVGSINGSLPGRRYRHAMAAGENGVVYMFGGQDVDGSSQFNDLWILSGDVEGASRFTSQCDAVWFSYAHLHGLLMGTAWGLLLPLGFLIARYYKNTKKVWFVFHVSLQIVGVLMTIAAFVMIWPATNPRTASPHAIIGILLTAIAIQQPINGIFRPHTKEGKKKGKRRICWEYYHRVMGIAGIVIGFVQITLGVFLIVSPLGVWITWICLLFLWVITFVVHEIIKIIRSCSKADTIEDEAHEMKEKH